MFANYTLILSNIAIRGEYYDIYGFKTLMFMKYSGYVIGY